MSVNMYLVVEEMCMEIDMLMCVSVCGCVGNVNCLLWCEGVFVSCEVYVWVIS